MRTKFHNPSFNNDGDSLCLAVSKSFSTVVDLSASNNPFKQQLNDLFLEDNDLIGQPTDASANNLHQLIAHCWGPLRDHIPFLKVYPPLGAKAEHKLPLWA